MFTELHAIFCCTILKVYIHQYQNLNRKVISKLSGSYWWTQVSPNSYFHLKAGFYHWQYMIVNCFPWSDGLTLLIFETMLAKCPGLNNHCLSVVLASTNSVLSKKTQLIQLTIQTIAQVLYLNMQQKTSFIFPLWAQRILRRYKNGWGLIKYNIFIKFNKLIIFTTSSGIFLNGMVFTLCAGVCVYCEFMAVKNTVTSTTMSLLWLSWFMLSHHYCFTHYCFCTFHSNVNAVVLLGKKFWPHTPPRRDSKNFRIPWDNLRTAALHSTIS